jgi:radical SAM protein with 4Fe4S-binding SPASM domain
MDKLRFNNLKHNILKNIFMYSKHRLNQFRYDMYWKTVKIKKLKPTPFPVVIHIEVNDICNLKCIMCARNTNGYKLNTGTKMPFDLYKKLIDEGTPLCVSFGGGDEPLLRKDLPEFIKYAKDNGVVEIKVITNGTMLNRDMGKRLIESGMTWFSVSVDASSKEVYDKIRVGSDFEKVENNINNFVELKKSFLPFMRLSFVDMPVNKHEKESFVEKWIDKVNYIDIQKYINFEEINNGPPDIVLCVEPFRRLWIRANGDVYPCCNFSSQTSKYDELLIGNVNDSSVMDLWNGDKLEKIRDGFRCFYKTGSIELIPLTCKDCMGRKT